MPFFEQFGPTYYSFDNIESILGNIWSFTADGSVVYQTIPVVIQGSLTVGELSISNTISASGGHVNVLASFSCPFISGTTISFVNACFLNTTITNVCELNASILNIYVDSVSAEHAYVKTLNVDTIYQTCTYSSGGLPTCVYNASLPGIQYTTSSILYKKNVVDLPTSVYNLSMLDALRPIIYNASLTMVNDTRDYAGFIAEEVETVCPSLFTIYDGEGNINSIDYPRLTVLLCSFIQQLHGKITTIEQGLVSRGFFFS